MTWLLRKTYAWRARRLLLTIGERREIGRAMQDAEEAIEAWKATLSSKTAADDRSTISEPGK